MPAFSFAALVRAFIMWALFIAAECVQGALRRLILRPEMQLAVRGVSVLIGVAVIFAITWLGWRWLRIGSVRGALATGAFWAALTFGFDLALGRALGGDWASLMSDYDLPHGGLMGVGLVLMAMTPWAVRHFRGDSAKT